jgi:hypothetical protein
MCLKALATVAALAVMIGAIVPLWAGEPLAASAATEQIATSPEPGDPQQDLPNSKSESKDPASSDRQKSAPVKQPASVPIPGRKLPTIMPGYETREIDGFLVLFSKRAIEESIKAGGKPFDAIVSEFHGLNDVLPGNVLKVLRGVRIWIEWDERAEKNPKVVARYWHNRIWAPDAGEPWKTDAVEVLSLKRLTRVKSLPTNGVQLVLLHELAHVVHVLFLPGGCDNPAVTLAYKQAKERGLYKDVKDAYGRLGPAYALTNELEYFAELSCAYLDRCYYFPFDCDDLKDYDRPGYDLVKSVWSPPGFTPRKHNSEKAHGIGKPTTSIVKKAEAKVMDPAARAKQDERTAATLLRLAKEFLGMKEKRAVGIRRLDDIVRKYPDSKAAKEAQALKQELPDK